MVSSEMFKSNQHEIDYMAAYEKTLSLWPVHHESIFVETEYGTTHILVSGREYGKPLFLLNGFGFSATMWYPNVQALEADYRVYAVDVIGEFNRSTVKKHFREKRDYVNWLIELLDKLKISKADFAGHSNGGWHVLNLAIHAQHRINRIVLLAPAASFAPFRKQFGLRLFAANMIRIRPVIINYCAKWFIARENHNKVSDHLFEQFYHGIKGFAWKYKILIPSVFSDEELLKINVPTLMIIGEKEVIYNYNHVFSRAKKLIPHIQTLSIPGVGHGTNMEKPDIVNHAIMNFLQIEGG